MDGNNVLSKDMRLRLSVVCGVAATMGLIFVGSVVASNADSGQRGAQNFGSQAAAMAAAPLTKPEDAEDSPRPDPMVVAAATASFGSKLVDGRGETLYVFSLDAPGKSKCAGPCTQAWEPMRSPGGKPRPGPGVNGSSVGTIQRPDGSDQVTFNGRPVYYYSGDSSPGQSNGHGRSAFGGQWSAKPPSKP